MDFVLDASAIVELQVGSAPSELLRRQVLTGIGAAPELIDLGVVVDSDRRVTLTCRL